MHISNAYPSFLHHQISQKHYLILLYDLFSPFSEVSFLLPLLCRNASVRVKPMISEISYLIAPLFVLIYSNVALDTVAYALFHMKKSEVAISGRSLLPFLPLAFLLPSVFTQPSSLLTLYSFFSSLTHKASVFPLH